MKKPSTMTSRQVIVTSENPVKISWVVTAPVLQKMSSNQEEMRTDQICLEESKQKVTDEIKQPESDSFAKLGLSMCPGKNMAAGRDGKAYQRDIAIDVLNYA